jgi:hypothetical protein
MMFSKVSKIFTAAALAFYSSLLNSGCKSGCEKKNGKSEEKSLNIGQDCTIDFDKAVIDLTVIL